MGTAFSWDFFPKSWLSAAVKERVLGQAGRQNEAHGLVECLFVNIERSTKASYSVFVIPTLAGECDGVPKPRSHGDKPVITRPPVRPPDPPCRTPVPPRLEQRPDLIAGTAEEMPSSV